MPIDPNVLKYAETLFDHRFREEIIPVYQKRLVEIKTRWPTQPQMPFSGVDAKRLIEVESVFAKDAAVAQVECLATAVSKSGLDFDDEVFRKGLDKTSQLLERHKKDATRRVLAGFTKHGSSLAPGLQEAVEKSVDANMGRIHDSVLGLLKVKLHESGVTREASARQFASVDDDHRFARQAIEEARKSVSEPDGKPHPKVGAVVVKNGQVLSNAHRGELLGNHAEYVALERNLSDAAVAGSTVYTTLEPCTTRSHPKIPCADRLIERKVARVVIGMLDPDPRITGRGQRKLRTAGIITDLFAHDLMAEVEELNRDFTRYCEQQSEHAGPASASAATDTTHTEIASPIESLTLLGWNIKQDEKVGISFEIANKPLPNMQESAGYFRALRKPFRLHLQQVPSIAGFRFLSGIDNCVGLGISASDIVDISELRDLTSLRTLVISQTPFTIRNELNISAVASLVNLETLGLGMSRVSSLEPLRGLTKLASLNVGGSLVRDLSHIRGLALLKSLDVRDSNVTDVSALDGAEFLEELTVDAKQIPSLSHLSRLTSLHVLHIIAQVPVDMTAVGALSHLKSLFIWGPPIIDLSFIRRLSKLTRLQISGFGFLAGRSRVVDVDAIGDLGQLRTLTVGEVQIDSLRFLARCSNLMELNLSGLPITSVSELAGLTALKQISLVDVSVVDVSPFLSLPNLEKLSLLRTPARADVISELQRRGIRVVIN